MKTLKNFTLALSLILALAVVTFAGEIHIPAPPPPDIYNPGEIQIPATSLTGELAFSLLQNLLLMI
jgi:hypothetical protein